MSEIVISKGSYSVTIYPNQIPEEYANKLTVLPIPQTASNQSSGAKDTKILDLLRLTHTIIIKGYITASAEASSATNDSGGASTLTAKECKEILKTIIEGAGANGGTCALAYDGDTYNGYIEKVIMTEKAADDPATRANVEEGRYEINLTFVEGVAIGV